MGQLIASIPRTPAGNLAVRHLREHAAEQFGLSYLESLGDRLGRAELESGSVVRQLNESFHLLEVKDGGEIVAIIRVLQFHNQLEPSGARGKIDSIELNLPAELSSPTVLLDPVNHPANLVQLNIAAAKANSVTGHGVRVAIVDSGAEGIGFVHDFYDLLSTTNQHPGKNRLIDNHGHGTTMATIIHEIARDAEIDVVRVTDRGGMALWDVLAGICVAAIDCAADITNLSLGVTNLGGKTCPFCLSLAHVRSLAFEKLLDALAQLNWERPVWVAAVGNKGQSSGFEYPAAYTSVMATGAVNAAQYRSRFSNYGTTGHPYYVMAPGGETLADFKTVTEAVDSINSADHAGTSEATAYTSGVLALLRSETAYRAKSRIDFLDAVIQNHCVAPAHSSPTPADYGAGLIRYSPPVAVGTPGTTSASQRSTGQGGLPQFIDHGDQIAIDGINVSKDVVMELLRDLPVLKPLRFRGRDS